MKKLLFGSFLILAFLQDFSQSFHLGALVIDLNAGLEGYNVQYNYKLKNLGKTLDTTIRNGAINHNLALGVEVGLAKWFGLGLRGNANTFFTDVDKLTHNKPEVTSSELMLMVNFHPVVRKHFDLVLGSDIGLSSLNFKTNDSLGTVIKGTGSYFDLYLNPRFYLGRFGFNVRAFVPFVNYGSLSSNNTLYNEYVVAKWKANGFGMSVGIQMKFF